MALLPSFFMLKSGGRYLSVTENIPAANLPSGFLKFDEEQIWSPRAKFAAEAAETGDGRRLFHIRSLYNNKYLVTKQIDDESNSWIVASAKKPEEDKSKASCTLFEPHSLADDDDQTTTTVRLRHVGTGISAATHSLSPDDDTHHQVCWYYPLESRSNLKTKTAITSARFPFMIISYIRSSSPDWISEINGWSRSSSPLLMDRNYRIKDSYSGKFWRRRDNWIKAEVDDQSNETLFSFVQIKDNVVALRNLGNNAFCGAYTESQSINCLCAIYPTLSKQTRLIVEEPVIQREISDLEYRLSDSRIYNQQIQEVDTQYGSNNSTQDNTMTLSFSTTDSRTTSWNNSVSISLGVSVTFETTIVPFIEKGDIELSIEFGYTHEWGGSVTTEHTRETSYTVTVAPLTTVKVTMLATTGVCDVPFSYTQRDLLPTGEWVETRKDDGLFTGINSYDIHYQSDVVPLQDTS